jgi:uncharacterized protein YkwD
MLLGAGCSQGVASPLPGSDGYGPAGGSDRPSGPSSSSGGTSTPAPTPTTPPSQPSSSGGGSGSGGGGGSGSSGSSGGDVGPTGYDAGTYDAGGGGDYNGGISGDGGDVAALLPLCVSQVNEFRDQNDEVPLTESSDLESYAAAAASADAHSGVRNGYFDDTGGGGVAATEDELDGARFEPGGTAQQTLEQGLLDDEEDNGNAAANLLDTQFSQVGCGFAQDLSGNWWVVIALR